MSFFKWSRPSTSDIAFDSRYKVVRPVNSSRPWILVMPLHCKCKMSLRSSLLEYKFSFLQCFRRLSVDISNAMLAPINLLGQSVNNVVCVCLSGEDRSQDREMTDIGWEQEKLHSLSLLAPPLGQHLKMAALTDTEDYTSMTKVNLS